MKRAFSLKGKKTFSEVFQNGKRFRGKGFQLIVLSKDEPNIKMGISISKHFGKAYERNFVKRQIRAIWAGSLGNMQSGLRAIVRPNAAAKFMPYAEKEQMLRRLLLQAGVLHEQSN